MTTTPHGPEAARQAEDLHEQAMALEDKDAALALYTQALALDPARPSTLYNIGLIHKYRGEWQLSEDFNQRAVDLRPDDEASNWNLAIAATALGHWQVARSVWHRLGMPIEPGDTPIEHDFGISPVRLCPDGEAEVVWGRRLDPVRLRVENIPFPGSGYRIGDIVLHDGAPVGYRQYRDQEYGVFNVLMLAEPSTFSTYELTVHADQVDLLAQVSTALDAADIPCEDWSANTRVLCKACSEGRAHEQHEHVPAERQAGRSVYGVAVEATPDLEARIRSQLPAGVRFESLALKLAAPTRH